MAVAYGGEGNWESSALLRLYHIEDMSILVPHMMGKHRQHRFSYIRAVAITKTTEDKRTKKDDLLSYKMERIPFLEEQERKVKEQGKLLTMDIERLLLSEDNRFDFINEVAAEANEYVENNRDDYGGAKKAILHVLSNRINDSGFYRPEGYAESDPFLPGPGYLKEEFT